jgi:hypothetical protein
MRVHHMPCILNLCMHVLTRSDDWDLGFDALSLAERA